MLSKSSLPGVRLSPFLPLVGYNLVPSFRLAKGNAFPKIIGRAIETAQCPRSRFIRIVYCYSTPLGFTGLLDARRKGAGYGEEEREGWDSDPRWTKGRTSSERAFLSGLFSSKLKRDTLHDLHRDACRGDRDEETTACSRKKGRKIQMTPIREIPEAGRHRSF